MAISAAMTISSATAKTGQRRVVTCTVTNTAATAVNVTRITPVITPNGSLDQHVAATCGNPPLGANMPVNVPGSSGTRTFSWPVVVFEPMAGATPTGVAALSEPASRVYDVGAVVVCSDGSITTASTTTLTVTPST